MSDDILKPLKIGDTLPTSHKLWNKLIGPAMQGASGFGTQKFAPPLDLNRPQFAYILNAAGDYPAGSPIGINNTGYPLSARSAVFGDHLAYDHSGSDGDYAGRLWGIALEPITSGGAGRVMLSGQCLARVNWTSRSTNDGALMGGGGLYDFAHAMDGEDALRPGFQGNCKLLQPRDEGAFDEDDVQLMWVQVGQQSNQRIFIVKPAASISYGNVGDAEIVIGDAVGEDVDLYNPFSPTMGSPDFVNASGWALALTQPGSHELLFSGMVVPQVPTSNTYRMQGASTAYWVTP